MAAKMAGLTAELKVCLQAVPLAGCSDAVMVDKSADAMAAMMVCWLVDVMAHLMDCVSVYSKVFLLAGQRDDSRDALMDEM